MINKFNPNTIKQLKYYVYVLTYKENNKEVVFYVGKGKANRVFSHFNYLSKMDVNQILNNKEIVLTDKQKTIINSNQIYSYIINGELTENEALSAESQLISLLKRFDSFELTNIVNGHKPFGIYDTRYVDGKYSKQIDLFDFSKKNKVNILAFKVNDYYYYESINKDSRCVLEGMWKLNIDRANKADIVIGVHNSIIFGVYKMVKGSAIKINNKFKDQRELDDFAEFSKYRGKRITGEDYEWLVKNKRALIKLDILIPPISNNFIFNSKIDESSKEYKIAKKIIGKRIDIKDQKFNSQNPVKYFYWINK